MDTSGRGEKSRQFGLYQVGEVIGRGGMAVVHKAFQPALRRHVAIKLLLPHCVQEERFRARFQQEAETVGRLEHLNILPIYDYGQEGDLPYIVMPLVTGGTLRDWLRRGVSLERGLQVLSRVLGALEYAHTRQPVVIHRDLKPSNILMHQEGWPLLTDFGLAKIIEPSLRVTRPGTLVGTPEYMAPEQGQGAPVDHRADIYAMGILLYELLTGRVPFEDESAIAVILRHLQEPVPSPRTFNPALAPVWEEVIQRSLAKDPNARYPSAGEMDEAIQAAWRQVQRESGDWDTGQQVNRRELSDSAVRALAQGDWPRVISLCGQLLEVDPGHPDALRLLTQAHEALRRPGVEPQTLPAPAPSESPAPSAALIVREGSEPGRTYALDRGVVTLGRASDSDLPLQDSNLSRRHCQIRWVRGGYVLEDLGSSNGTFVNGAPVQVARLQSGDLIQIGTHVLEFTLSRSTRVGQRARRRPDDRGLGTPADQGHPA